MTIWLPGRQCKCAYYWYYFCIYILISCLYFILWSWLYEAAYTSTSITKNYWVADEWIWILANCPNSHLIKAHSNFRGLRQLYFHDETWIKKINNKILDFLLDLLDFYVFLVFFNTVYGIPGFWIQKSLEFLAFLIQECHKTQCCF